jgi:thioredoxin reductase (NADPH)
MTETEKNTEKLWDVIMIGAGPAALSAAIYTTREDLSTLLLDKGPVGGLAAVTDWVDNYPGFPKGVAGLELSDLLQKQAERFGTKFDFAEVEKIIDEGHSKLVKTNVGDFKAKSVLIATGSDYKKVNVPGEAEYYARGVHYCATCDGAFYREKRLVVVGGGNSAVQESLFLTRYASHIDMLVRSQLSCSDVLQKELEKNPKITVHLGVTTDEIVGDKPAMEHGKIIKVIGTDTASGQKVEFPTDGVFVFVGLSPNTDFIKGQIELDEIGFVKTNLHLETNIHGVFAAGDVRSGATMQIASASGEGATAALMIRQYLEGRAMEHEPLMAAVATK